MVWSSWGMTVCVTLRRFVLGMCLSLETWGKSKGELHGSGQIEELGLCNQTGLCLPVYPCFWNLPSTWLTSSRCESWRYPWPLLTTGKSHGKNLFCVSPGTWGDGGIVHHGLYDRNGWFVWLQLPHCWQRKRAACLGDVGLMVSCTTVGSPTFILNDFGQIFLSNSFSTFLCLISLVSRSQSGRDWPGGVASREGGFGRFCAWTQINQKHQVTHWGLLPPNSLQRNSGTGRETEPRFLAE